MFPRHLPEKRTPVLFREEWVSFLCATFWDAEIPFRSKKNGTKKTISLTWQPPSLEGGGFSGGIPWKTSRVAERKKKRKEKLLDCRYSGAHGWPSTSWPYLPAKVRFTHFLWPKWNERMKDNDDASPALPPWSGVKIFIIQIDKHQFTLENCWTFALSFFLGFFLAVRKGIRKSGGNFFSSLRVALEKNRISLVTALVFLRGNLLDVTQTIMCFK